jgi:hypothetical protein
LEYILKRKYMRAIRITIPLLATVIANGAYFFYERHLSAETKEREHVMEYRRKSEVEIAEAVLRWEIKKHSVTFEEEGGTACVSLIQDLNHNQDFLKRLSDLKILIKDTEACESDFIKGVTDKETHKHSVQIFISGIKWEKDDSVWVSSGYLEGNLGASSGRVFVVRDGEKWKIIKEEIEMVSKLQGFKNNQFDINLSKIDYTTIKKGATAV